jgi:hypothetical protein
MATIWKHATEAIAYVPTLSRNNLMLQSYSSKPCLCHEVSRRKDGNICQHTKTNDQDIILTFFQVILRGLTSIDCSGFLLRFKRGRFRHLTHQKSKTHNNNTIKDNFKWRFFIWLMLWYDIDMCRTPLSHNWRCRSADGIPWWSPSQVIATNYCVCSVSVCIYSDCLVFINAAQLDNKVIFYPLSPLTLQVAVHSCNATQTI